MTSMREVSMNALASVGQYRTLYGPDDTPAPHITVRGLSKTFQGVVIYDDFNLDIPRGRFTSVFGPNGCGKSTLINLIAGLIPADKGEVLFGGKTGYVHS